MSLEQNIADLVTATTSLTEAVNVKKQNLDGAVSTAVDSADAASTSESNAATSASEASGYASSAESSATAAANSASDAATSATTATNAATSASESANNAADSATLAGQSASDAVTIVSSVKQSSSRIVPMFTPNGQVTYMYRIPAFNLEDIDPSGQLGEGLHPAFIFNGVPDREIFVGAYPAAEVNGEIVCQPGLDPRSNINFDNARAACQALGAGWDLMSNWDWAAIALWCAANGFSPRGNTNYGRSHSHRFETATRVVDLAPGVAESSLGRTLTGSGPAAWTHDGTGNGIHDLVGNVWEWVTGLLLEENIFKIAPDNGVYPESEYIDTLVEAAATGTFSTRAYDDPTLILKQAMVVPTTGLTYDGRFYKNETGQRLPRRGGNWYGAGDADLDALALFFTRTGAFTSDGFRPRFRNQ